MTPINGINSATATSPNDATGKKCQHIRAIVMMNNDAAIADTANNAAIAASLQLARHPRSNHRPHVSGSTIVVVHAHSGGIRTGVGMVMVAEADILQHYVRFTLVPTRIYQMRIDRHRV